MHEMLIVPLHYLVAGKQTDFVPDPKAKWAGLLEKKWTSVIRLQKKVRSSPSLLGALATVY